MEHDKNITENETTDSLANTKVVNSFDDAIRQQSLVSEKNNIAEQVYFKPSELNTNQQDSFPIGVIFIAIIFLIGSVVNIIGALSAKGSTQVSSSNFSEIITYIYFITAAAQTVVGIGLFFRIELIRSLAVVLIGLNILLSIWKVFSFNVVVIVIIVLQIFAIGYLNSGKVKSWFN